MSASLTELEIAGTVTLGPYVDINALPSPTTTSGAVTLTDSSDNKIVSNGSAATLNVSDNTISGAGTIGDAHLTLNVEAGGVIDATGTNFPLIASTAGTITNAGTLEASAGATLQIDNNVGNTGGTIEAFGSGAWSSSTTLQSPAAR